MKLILAPILLDLLRSSISPAFVFVEAKPDSKATKRAKAKFPKRLDAMSMCMSVDHESDDDTGGGGGSSGPLFCGRNPLFGYSTLPRDLFCQDLIGKEESGTCAISLIGREAVLDCGGRTISQAIPAAASATSCGVFDPYSNDFDPKNPVDLVKTKQDCGLPYAFGICLLDGAKATNCNVQGFAVGIYADSSSSDVASEVKNSIVANNRIGIFANADMIIGAEAMFTSVSVLLNGDTGIFAYNGESPTVAGTPRRNLTMKKVWAEQNGFGQGSVGSAGNGIRITSEGICEVDFDGLISNANAGDGVSMYCNRGGEMRLKDVGTAFNYGSGISLTAGVFASEMSLEGAVTSRFNGGKGLSMTKAGDPDGFTPSLTFRLDVKGDVNLDSNGDLDAPNSAGFFVRDAFASLEVVVEEGGSIQSCDNKNYDVAIDVGKGFTLVGDMTCNPDKSLVNSQVPNCVPCPPGSP